MLNNVRRTVFSFYEQPSLRNWFYTLAFAVFVPIGFRFAILAWTFGDDFDRVMSIVGGILVGITAVVTLLRVWAVPPRRTVQPEPGHPHPHERVDFMPNASEMYLAMQGRSAQNREMAKAARALGSPRRSFR